MKKLISILLAAVMLFTLSAPAWAATVVDLRDYPAFSELCDVSNDTVTISLSGLQSESDKVLNEWAKVKSVIDGTCSDPNLAVVFDFSPHGSTFPDNYRFYFYLFDKREVTLRTKNAVNNPYPEYYLSGPIMYFNFERSRIGRPIGFLAFSSALTASGELSLSSKNLDRYHLVWSSPNFPLEPSKINAIPHNLKIVDDLAPQTHFVTINYQYSDGTKAADSVTQSVEEGAAYNIPSPVIPGHTPDKAAVTGTMSGSDITATVTYTKNRHNLTVNYLYSDGTMAADSVSKIVGYGESYSIPSPAVTGYKPDKAIVSGSMPDKAQTVTVTYGKNLYTLTVNYVYEDGSKAAETVTKSVAYQAAYSIFSPAITGYTPDKPTVTGIMKDSDLTAEVTYKRNTHSLKIDYFYANGLKAADSVSKTLGYNEAYSFPSPAISGYFADKPTVSGNMPDSDLTVKVTYSKELADYSLTVHYVYQDGTTAADSIVTRYPAHFLYQIESPAIEGYHPDTPLVSGKMPENDLTVTVTYIKDESGGGGSGGGDSGDNGDSGGGSGGGGDSSIFPPLYPPYEGDFPFPDYTPEYNGDNPFDVAGKYPPYEGDFPFPDYTPEYNGDNPFDIAGQYPPCDPAQAVQYFMDYYKGLL